MTRLRALDWDIEQIKKEAPPEGEPSWVREEDRHISHMHQTYRIKNKENDSSGFLQVLNNPTMKAKIALQESEEALLETNAAKKIIASGKTEEHSQKAEPAPAQPAPTITATSVTTSPNVEPSHTQKALHTALQHSGMPLEERQKINTTPSQTEEGFVVHKNGQPLLNVEKSKPGQCKISVNPTTEPNEAQAQLMVATLMATHNVEKNSPELKNIIIKLKGFSPDLQQAIQKEAVSQGFASEHIKIMAPPSSAQEQQNNLKENKETHNSEPVKPNTHL